MEHHLIGKGWKLKTIISNQSLTIFLLKNLRRVVQKERDKQKWQKVKFKELESLKRPIKSGLQFIDILYTFTKEKKIYPTNFFVAVCF